MVPLKRPGRIYLVEEMARRGGRISGRGGKFATQSPRELISIEGGVNRSNGYDEE